ncbi:hypothetical protein HMPREF3187_00523 [Aerococcus christensenii]|uniref:Uncharacterized protein n=1 Tax=Aerococcus christensenii TaxID=87541 RepID=A0A133Y2M2_9LACT|nr:hypothetical protein HMPREF3187_00523 [Aerococcus christensenii]
MVIIPESKGFNFKRVVNKPVIAPAAIPAKKAIPKATTGWKPKHMAWPPNPAPKVKLPSVVISGAFKIRKLINIPNPMTAQTLPSAKALIKTSIF